MTDFPSFSSADELASAYLDDEVTPAERAQLEADPVLLARVGELRAVRDALASPVPPRSAAEREVAIRSAMDAAIGDDHISGGAPPVALDSRRRPGRSGRVGLAVLGAAAAVIAVVALAATRTDHDTTSSASLATAAVPPAPEAATSERNAGAGATVAAGATTTASAGGAGQDTATPSADAGVTGLPALGTVDDAASLRAALATASGPLAATAAASPSDGCAVAGSRLVASVIWQGVPALVFVDGAEHAVVVSQATCARLADVPLP